MWLKNRSRQVFTSLSVIFTTILLLTGCSTVNFNGIVLGEKTLEGSVVFEVDLADSAADKTRVEVEEALLTKIQDVLPSEVVVVVDPQLRYNYIVTIDSSVLLQEGTTPFLYGEVYFESTNFLLTLNTVEFFETISVELDDIVNFDAVIDMPATVLTASQGGRIFDRTVHWEFTSLLESFETGNPFQSEASLIPPANPTTITLISLLVLLFFVVCIMFILFIVKKTKREKPVLVVEDLSTTKDWVDEVTGRRKKHRFRKIKDNGIVKPVGVTPKVDEVKVADNSSESNEEPFGIQVKLPPLLSPPPGDMKNKKRRK